MPKKTLRFLLIFLLCICLASCAAEKRIPFSELLIRLDRADKNARYNIEEAFFGGGEWLLQLPGGILLSARENAAHELESVQLTVKKTDGYNASGTFRSLCADLARAFTAEENVKDALNEISLCDDDILFKNYAGFSEIGRYKLTFFSCERALSFIIQYKRAVSPLRVKQP